jgi:hypothetical protein
MSEIEITQEDREAAANAHKAWLNTDPSADERMRAGNIDWLAEAFACHRAEALEEAAFAVHSAIFDLALGDTGNGRNVTPAQYSEAAIDAIRALRTGSADGREG